MFPAKTTAFATLLAVAMAGPLAAVDIDEMGQAQKKSFCLAYVFLDLETQKANNIIDEEQYKRARIEIAHNVQNKGDNYNYAGDYRRLDAAIQTILEEEPTVGDVAENAAACRTYLRL